MFIAPVYQRQAETLSHFQQFRGMRAARMRQELLTELRDEAEDKELLEQELAQDADDHPYPFTAITSFSLSREG